MNPIASAEELIRTALQAGSLSAGSALPVLLHTAEYGEIIGVLMLEEEKRLAELRNCRKVAVEWRFGYFLVSGVGVVLFLLSMAEARGKLGNYVSELWIDHCDPSQGLQASVLDRLARRIPVHVRIYNMRAQLVKSIHAETPPSLLAFAKATLDEATSRERWGPARFKISREHLQDRYDVEALWNRVVPAQMEHFRKTAELLPIVFDLP